MPGRPRADAAESEAGQVRFERSIPVGRSYDVVVCGGGPSGCAAALAARREGLTVLLVEGQGQLGGMATSGMVSQWLGGRNQKGEWVVGGLFRSIAEEAASRGYALLPKLDPAKKYHPFGWFNWFIHGVPLDPYGVARFLDEKMKAFDVDVLLLTQAVDVLTDGDRITHVVTFNKSGLTAVPARAVIDATGDADMAARSGCEYVKGRGEDGLMTPATLEFHVSHVDQARLTRYIEEQRDPKLRNKIQELRQQGVWPFPYDIFICTQLTQPDTFYVNTIRLVGIDGTDGAVRHRRNDPGPGRDREARGDSSRAYSRLRTRPTQGGRAAAGRSGNAADRRRLDDDGPRPVRGQGVSGHHRIQHVRLGPARSEEAQRAALCHRRCAPGLSLHGEEGTEHAAAVSGDGSPAHPQSHLPGPSRLRGAPGAGAGSRHGPLHGHGRGQRRCGPSSY